MVQLRLNISGSEQPSSPPLWSESGCHTFRLAAAPPYSLYFLSHASMQAHIHAHTPPHTSTKTQTEKQPILKVHSGIDLNSILGVNLALLFFKCLKNKG